MEKSTTQPSIVALSTAPNRDEAVKISKALLENKLAACVNIVPKVESLYWWEGKVQQDEEVLMVIKTRKELVQELTECILKNHSYSVPEVISMDITGGNEKYLNWITESTKSK